MDDVGLEVNNDVFEVEVDAELEDDVVHGGIWVVVAVV